MKNVLFISYNFPPMLNVASLQAYTYVRHLQKYDWNPHVLTVKKGDWWEPVDNSLMGKIPPVVHVSRTRYFNINYMSLLLRYFPSSIPVRIIEKVGACLPPDGQIGWLPFAYRQAMRIVRSQRIDAIYTLSAPYTSHLIGYLVKRKTGIPWVAHFGDEWTQNPNRRYPFVWQRRVDAWLERLTLDSADQIVLAWAGMESLFPIEISAKSSVVTLSFEETDFRSPANERKGENKFCITYTGSLYSYRIAINFLKAMEELLAEKKLAINKVDLLFIGRARSIAFTGFENSHVSQVVRCIGMISHDQIVGYLKQASVLLLIMDQLDRATYCIQGKTFEYIASGTPILALGPQDSATSELIRRTKTGIVVNYEDIEGIKKAILNMYTKWGNGELSIEPNWQEIGKNEARVVTMKLAQTLDHIIGGC